MAKAKTKKTGSGVTALKKVLSADKSKKSKTAKKPAAKGKK